MRVVTGLRVRETVVGFLVRLAVGVAPVVTVSKFLPSLAVYAVASFRLSKSTAIACEISAEGSSVGLKVGCNVFGVGVGDRVLGIGLGAKVFELESSTTIGAEVGTSVVEVVGDP